MKFSICFHFQNKSVVRLLVDNKHLTHSARQNALEMFIQAGYNIHRDSWSPVLSSVQSKSASAQRTRAPSSPSSHFSSSSSSTSVSEVITTTSLSDEELMFKWLEKRRQQFPRLMCLCRTRIRKRLSYCNKGRSIVNVVPRLNLPAILINFVGFKGDGILDRQASCGDGGGS
jgi:hypothetical protein